MGGGARRFLLFLHVCSFARAAGAGVVVNELYYDHPGADAGHEFVEILNTGAGTVSLDGLVLEFHNGTGTGWATIWRAPDGLTLAPDQLLVVGGVAVVPAPAIVFELALQNGPDAIRLVGAEGVLDVVGYGGLDDGAYVERRGADAVDAGQSIARTPDGRDTDDNALDFLAAVPTPGRRNVARHDAAPSAAPGTPLRAASGRPGTERVAIEVENRGLVAIPVGAVAVVARDSTALGERDVSHSANALAVAPGARERVALDLPLIQPGYHVVSIVTVYAPDERPANDRLRLLRRVGPSPVLVSEIMSAPRAGCPQFVELYNASAQAVDATGFSLRDTRSRAASVAGDSVTIGARAFVVIAAAADALRACHPRAPRALEVEGTWPAFNKSGGAFADSAVVLDRLGIPLDAVAYPGLASGVSGRSLERVDLFVTDAPRDAVWRLSRDSGGSPGHAGSGALDAPPRDGCRVSPNPFFPDAGDVLRVAVAAAPGVARVVVRVYDPSGRAVAEVGAASAFPAVLLWDGRRGGGGVVRAGIYVLACESFAADGTRVGVEKVVVGCASRSP